MVDLYSHRGASDFYRHIDYAHAKGKTLGGTIGAGFEQAGILT